VTQYSCLEVAAVFVAAALVVAVSGVAVQFLPKATIVVVVEATRLRVAVATIPLRVDTVPFQTIRSLVVVEAVVATVAVVVATVAVVATAAVDMTPSDPGIRGTLARVFSRSIGAE
jgi:hypothetical protein